MLQFVPLENSLEDNAPGYNSSQPVGPLCWKCDGIGVRRKNSLVCTVCNGSKRLPVKQDVLSAADKPGSFSKQKEPPGWTPTGPVAFHSSIPDEQLPHPLQPRNGEQLCSLVGNWRIYQRIGGHRWTTDDLVTAWVAGKRARESAVAQPPVMNCLDLGCGNGSVLMMVAWQYPEARCAGLEARSEAVALATRSIMYNCGPEQARVTVHNADFRSLYADVTTVPSSGGTDTGAVEAVRQTKFDLVTGTPPYFRVDFTMDNRTGERVVAGAHIRQGGMPTCKESAPARCEFRGGIEAYCAAAARVLAADGALVVCENWANHERVQRAAPTVGLRIVSVQRVIGREGKPPLFAVFTMVHDQTKEKVGEGSRAVDEPEYAPDLMVRDSHGAWTLQYAEVLREMSYPVASLHPSGEY